MGIDIKNCKLTMLVDSREQVWEHIKDIWDRKGISYFITKEENSLKVGDYTIVATLPNGEIIDFRNKVMIERKASLNELCGNLTEKRKDKKNRIVREFERAKEQNIKLVLLIEDLDTYRKILNGEFREDEESEMNKDAFIGMLMAYKARYNFEIVWLDKELSASYIYRLLYYEAREYLKNLK